MPCKYMNTCSQSEIYLFIFLIVSFQEQKIFNYNELQFTFFL